MKIYRKSIVNSRTSFSNKFPLPVFVPNPVMLAEIETYSLVAKVLIKVARELWVTLSENLCPESFQETE